MKRIFLLLLASLTLQIGYSQVSTVPSGSTLLGNTYLTPTETIFVGNGAKKYREVYQKRVIDSLLNLKLTATTFTAFQTSNAASIATKVDNSTYAAGIAGKVDNSAFNAFQTSNTAAIGLKVDKVTGAALLSSADKSKLDLLSTSQNSSLGTWNASTNTPVLTATPAAQGQEYTVSVPGTQSITGASTAFVANDKIKSNGTAWVRIPYVGVNSAEVAAIRNILPLNVAVYPNPTRTTGYYSSSNGAFVSGVTPYSGYLLNVADYGDKIYISAHIKDSGTAIAVYFDSNNAFLGNQFVGTSSDVAFTDQLLTLPAGTAKIGITEYNNTPSLVIKSGTLSTDILTKSAADGLYSQIVPLQKQVKLSLTASSNIVLYSSSISSGDYPWYVESMNALSGANTIPRGISGYNALSATQSLDQIFNNNPNLIVLEVGANDDGSLNSVGTFGAFSGEPLVTESDISIAYNGTKFIQAIDYIVRKIKAQYYNIRARANLTGSETETEKNAKIDAVLKPYLVFLTGFPQKRIDANSAFSNVANQLRKRNAIIEVCNKNNVHCIDTYKLLGWDMSLEPYWPGTTDKTTNYGVKTMDGLHPNKFGYYELTRIVLGGVGIINGGTFVSKDKELRKLQRSIHILNTYDIAA